MSGATVIDVEASFVNPENDVFESELNAPVTSALKQVVDLLVSIGSVVFFFWLLGTLFGLLAPFVGIILSFLLTFFLGMPLCAYIVQFANSCVLGVSNFLFGKILMPIENWVINLFS